MKAPAAADDLRSRLLFARPAAVVARRQFSVRRVSQQHMSDRACSVASARSPSSSSYGVGEARFSRRHLRRLTSQVTVLASAQSSAASAQVACTALRGCLEAEPEVLTPNLAARVIAALVATLSLHGHDSSVAEEACAAIFAAVALVTWSNECIDRVLAAAPGAIPALVAALKAHGSIFPSIARSTSHALVFFVASDTGAAALVEARGVSELVRSAQGWFECTGHSSSTLKPGSHIWCVEALAALAAHAGARATLAEAGAIEAIIELLDSLLSLQLRRGVAESAIISHVATLVANAAIDDTARARFLRSGSGTRALVAFLSGYVRLDKRGDANSAAEILTGTRGAVLHADDTRPALAHLCAALCTLGTAVEGAAALSDAGAPLPLLAVLADFPTDAVLCEPASWALRNIVCFGDPATAAALASVRVPRGLGAGEYASGAAVVEATLALCAPESRESVYLKQVLQRMRTHEDRARGQ
jgi:hypothetical protein